MSDSTPEPIPATLHHPDGWLGDFASPPWQFRPIPFWSWNERMDPAELRRQVDLFAKAGWGGVMPHARGGLMTPYLGQEWSQAIEAVIDQCKKHGMKVWLYDEDGWPSGTCGTIIPAAGPEHRIKCLCARRVGDNIPPGAAPMGSPHDGLQVYQWTAPLGDQRYRGFSYIDVLSEETVALFIHHAYQWYKDRFGPHFGKTIVGQFFDEPRCVEHLGLLPAGAVAFSSKLIETFAQMHGFDPISSLHLLFSESADCRRFRLQYHRTVSEMFRVNFVGQINAWCQRAGIALTGHMMSEESLLAQRYSGVSVMSGYRSMAVPGIDHLGYQVSERLTADQCRSVANQTGKRRVMSELYGASGNDLTFGDRLRIASQQLALGVNLLVPHLALYTMVGERKADHPPNLSYQQPWWERDSVIEGQLSRLCVAMSQGTYRAECLVVSPESSAIADWCVSCDFAESAASLVRNQAHLTTTPAIRNQIEQLDQGLKSLCETLRRSQIGFDLGQEQMLASDAALESVNGIVHLRVGSMLYPSVVLPPMATLHPIVFERLSTFTKQGGTVYASAVRPHELDGVLDAGLTEWADALPAFAVDQLTSRFASCDVQTNQADRPDLIVHQRDLPDGRRLVFVVNLEPQRTVAFVMSFKGAWQSITELSAESGRYVPLESSRSSDRLSVHTTLTPSSHRLYMLDLQGTISPMSKRSVAKKVVYMGDMNWTVERLDANALVLDRARYRRSDEDWSAQSVSAIAIDRWNRLHSPSEQLAMCFEFEVRWKQTRPVGLVCEAGAGWRIEVNGESPNATPSAGPFDHRWNSLEIGDKLANGSNRITLTPTGAVPARNALETIAPLYLFGDFSVQSVPVSDALTASFARFGRYLRFGTRRFVLVEPTPLQLGDVTQQGLAFYAGRLRLRALVSNVDLIVDHLNAATATIRIGSIHLADWLGAPVTVTIPQNDQFIDLTLYGTLRNLLGPHHGEIDTPDWVGPPAFLSRVRTECAALESWITHAIAPHNWTDDYILKSFGYVSS